MHFLVLKIDMSKSKICCSQYNKKVRMSCCLLKLINFVLQDRQALEADRLGSNPKRHSCETNGTFLGIQQWPASPPWWCHPQYMSRGQNQFISKASKGLLDIHRATFFKNLALYNTLVTSREEHSWHEQWSSVGVTLLFFLQEPWHLCSKKSSIHTQLGEITGDTIALLWINHSLI